MAGQRTVRRKHGFVKYMHSCTPCIVCIAHHTHLGGSMLCTVKISTNQLHVLSFVLFTFFFLFFPRATFYVGFCFFLFCSLLFPACLHAQLLAIMHTLITMPITELIRMMRTASKMMITVAMFYFSALHALVAMLVVPMHRLSSLWLI